MLKSKFLYITFIAINLLFINSLKFSPIIASIPKTGTETPLDKLRRTLNYNWLSAGAIGKAKARLNCGAIADLGKPGNNYRIYNWAGGPATTKIGLNLLNKTGERIAIAVSQNSRQILPILSDRYSFELNISNPTDINIRLVDHYGAGWTLKFPAGKTIYITLNRQGQWGQNVDVHGPVTYDFYPQSGPGSGSVGIIDKCILKDQNTNLQNVRIISQGNIPARLDSAGN